MLFFVEGVNGLSEGKVKRKTFVAREDLLEGLSDVARERGYSLYALINEIFDLALRAEEMGLDLRRVVEERGVLETAKKSGFVLGLESLWCDMADLVYDRAKDEALKSWFEAGVWFAKRYVANSGVDAFGAFKKDLKAFMWNVNDLSIERIGGLLSFRLVSPRFSEAFTFLFKAFICGAFDALGFKIVNEEVGRGIIRLEAIRKETA